MRAKIDVKISHGARGGCPFVIVKRQHNMIAIKHAHGKRPLRVLLVEA